MANIRIEALYLSPGHNYFGHHGKPAGENPIQSVEQVECVAGRGLVGDRFFDHKEDYRGQITFFDAMVFADLCDALQLHDKEPSALRRNVLTSGIDLNTLIGQEFEVQGVRFAGTVECSPCYWMDQALAPGAEDYLKGRGGLRARILSDGTLNVDAPTS